MNSFKTPFENKDYENVSKSIKKYATLNKSNIFKIIYENFAYNKKMWLCRVFNINCNKYIIILKFFY